MIIFHLLRRKVSSEMAAVNSCCWWENTLRQAEILPSGYSLGNFISTAEKIRLPDDCTIGYIIEALLEVTLTHTHLFHSHLENLQKLPTDTVLEQVSVLNCMDATKTALLSRVGDVTKVSSCQLRSIARVRAFLSQADTEKLIHAVISRL